MAEGSAIELASGLMGHFITRIAWCHKIKSRIEYLTPTYSASLTLEITKNIISLDLTLLVDNLLGAYFSGNPVYPNNFNVSCRFVYFNQCLFIFELGSRKSQTTTDWMQIHQVTQKIPQRTKCNFSTTVWHFYTLISSYMYTGEILL